MNTYKEARLHFLPMLSRYSRMSERVQHDEQCLSLHDRWCFRYDEQCSSLHAEELILCYLYCLQSSNCGAHKIINMFYQHYWYGKAVLVVVMYFAKTVLAPYIGLDAIVRHLCPILKCKSVMQKYHTTHYYIPWNSVFHISCQCWGISVTHFDWYHPPELLLPAY